MRYEGLDEEVTKNSLHMLYFLRFCGALSNPSLGLGPGLVQSQKTTLASSLNQLIWFRLLIRQSWPLQKDVSVYDTRTLRITYYELCAALEEPGICDLGLVKNVVDIDIIGEMERGKSGGRIVLGLGQRTRLNDRSTSKMVVEDGLPVGLVNRLGGHIRKNWYV